ncbi:fumarylacetoacetate hydrolase family protein [Mycolicibacterium sediminis]|uniref:5-carboxymethyl-2-hydroxymuconate isomerase n=1 Tax=Mycolicibacterium sediminis TaxID=1286180 RepID=A0A7I7QLL2_9MYCO|nr:fumarylacetoacetate hydrolase family protein [Mycolicibacterium sediminis]BBY27238.1 5-carboxymethyl-2-hydroxymuconate isomerase [Mycolicibacterium sediminis]
MNRHYDVRTIWGTARNFPVGVDDPPRTPQLFVKNTHAVIGPGEPLELTGSVAQRVVAEGELAIVVGRRCRALETTEQARAHIAGYCIANDVTARDLQETDDHWSRAKGLDGFCPLSTELVAPEDMPPWDEVVITTHVDTRLVQRELVSSAYVGPEDLVLWASQQFTLHPGDVFLLGTPDYLPSGDESGAVLRPGRTVTIAISGLGELITPVV